MAILRHGVVTHASQITFHSTMPRSRMRTSCTSTTAAAYTLFNCDRVQANHISGILSTRQCSPFAIVLGGFVLACGFCCCLPVFVLFFRSLWPDCGVIGEPAHTLVALVLFFRAPLCAYRFNRASVTDPIDIPSARRAANVIALVLRQLYIVSLGTNVPGRPVDGRGERGRQGPHQYS